LLHFLGGLTKEEHEDTKLVLLLNVPPSVLSYYKKWSYFIAEYSSDRYKIQLSAAISLYSTWHNTLVTEVVKGV
jgi:hypothetical protein